ncbi:MAG: hypothetical protein N2C14_30325, partial [Planctomycetales bacterium]
MNWWDFAAPQWAPWAVGAIVACLALLVHGYWNAPASNATRTLAGSMKLIGVVLLALCLLEPMWSGTRARPGANVFLILADNSRSLRIRDQDASESRGANMAKILTEEKAPWLVRVNQDFDVRQYVFDARVRRTRDFSELRFDGSSSSLATALTTLSDRYRKHHMAGVLLLTDGSATDWPKGFDASSLPPIYPIVVGESKLPRDVGLRSVRVSQTAFEDAPVSIQAQVVSQGYLDKPLVVQLLAESGEVLQEKTQTAASPDKPLTFRFQLRPPKPGMLFYQLRTFAEGEAEQFETPKTSREAALDNNSRWLSVDRGGGPYRILYVAGRPNWEYKFLNRGLEEDEQVQLVGLIRVAKREPKFDFRGRSGESSNPLFRGFGADSEEEAEYDQPVLIRQNTLNDAELRDGFPKSEQELYRYHAIVLDDLEAKFFTRTQMLLLEKFVSERGGGFLMLGGQESFRQGKFDRTPVANLLPVYLDALAP